MISCQDCGYDNQPGNEYCEICGLHLASASSTSTAPTPRAAISPNVTARLVSDPLLSETAQPTTSTFSPLPTAIPTSTTSPDDVRSHASLNNSKLISKQAGSSIPAFNLDAASMIVGIFDPSSGPPDIDLESFVGSDTVSREHAEIYLENGSWKVKDLTSTNGVFIKKSAGTRFGGRITMPESLEDGDEIAFAKVKFVLSIS
jgi:FHA domain